MVEATRARLLRGWSHITWLMRRCVEGRWLYKTTFTSAELFERTIECAAHEIFRDHISNASKDHYYEGGQKIYFDGWDGLGASAVLAAVAKLFARSHQKHGFDIFIHVDCSLWESRRSLQRRIAEELKLDRSTMELFVKQDEEDVFSGVDKSSRVEIPDVGQEIYNMTKGRTLLVIFHNGSDDEIDLARFGLPIFGSGNRLLWTFRGRFRLDPAIPQKVKSSDYYVFVHPYYARNTTDKLKLVHEEASQVVGLDDISPALIADCWLYLCVLEFDLHLADDAHTSNCWVCDGIIPAGDSAWQIGERLQEALRLEYLPPKKNISKLYPIIPFEVLQDKESVWLSVRHNNKNVRSTVPEDTTSYFLEMGKFDHLFTALPKNLFHQSSKLRVLSLSWCCFSFASPPFVCCRNLKLILVVSCRDEDAEFIGEIHKEKVKYWEFLKSLWVLDIRDTNWDWILSPSKMRLMTQLRELNLKEAGASCCVYGMAELELTWLCNLHRLRVIDSYTFITALAQDAFMGMQNLELLDLSGNWEMEVLPNFSAASRLSVLIVDGCSRLQQVEPGTLPKSLESFSFDGLGQAFRWKNSVQMPENKFRRCRFLPFYKNTPNVSKISLQGCEELKNVFLCGLPNLNELNLSDTAIKSLDLEAIEVAQIECLFLLGWRNHGSLKWGAGGHPRVKLLLIDFREKEETGPVDDCCQYYSCPLVQQEASQQMVHIVATDAKFLRAFKMSGGFGYISGITESNQHFHIHLASGGGQRKVIGNNKERVTITSIVGYPYMDVHNKVIKMDDNGEACTNHLTLGRHIEIAKGGCNWESEEQMKIMEHLMAKVESFHMHDHSSVTTGNLEIKTYREQFPNIRWCCIQRCPKLHTIFLVDRYPITRASFEKMDTLCVSHLLAVRCVWSRNLRFYQDWTGSFRAFQNLRYIHLKSCPRLMFVLPWYYPTLASLETIHITYCGEIRQNFPKRGDYEDKDCNNIEFPYFKNKKNIEFPSLKHIHLHELPMLQHICETDMLAPALETIVLRGCWSLKQLPAINCCRALDKPLAVVDCEKDWWDKLQWDGLEASRPLFSPRHSRYYKKVLPRVSVLR
uniref:Uncharacterized protein n=1 Tax=Avena sativa TaxID=4498 RepID=A0ACD5WSZ5_AVESA